MAPTRVFPERYVSVREWWWEVDQRLEGTDQTPADELGVLEEILAREGLRSPRSG